MVGPGLKALAKEYDFKQSGGKLYGVIEGFLICVWEGMGYKAMAVNLGLLEGGREGEEVSLVELLSKPMKDYRINAYHADGPVLTILFFDNPGTMKRIRDYVKMELPLLKARGFSGIERCGQCGQPMGLEPPQILMLGDSPISVHAHCADAAESDILRALDEERKEAETRARQAPPESPFAIFGAILGGVVGALPWMLLTAGGYVASLAAALIALGASYGYKLFGGRPGVKKLVIVILLTVVMVPLAEMAGEVVSLGYSIHTGEAQEAWGVPKEMVSPTEAPSLFLAALSDPETNGDLLSSLGRSLLQAYLFTALGIWATWGKLTRENLPGQRPTLRRLG